VSDLAQSIAMVLVLDDLSSLKMKIDRRASSLFGAAPKGQAPLQVMRIAVDDDGERSFVENEDVLDERKLDELRNVSAESVLSELHLIDDRMRTFWMATCKSSASAKAAPGRRWIFPENFLRHL